MSITLRQLEIFAAVCQEGKITSAADRVGLSQAAASQALAELEDQLQRRLFDRKGRRLKENTAGRALLPEAIQILDRVRQIESGASQTVNIRIAASLTVGNYMLPEFVGRFARQHPDAHFRMEIGNTEFVAASVRQFESDAGWIEGLARHPDLLSFPWREDQLVIIAAPNHPLAGRQATPEALAKESWVLRENGSGTREVFEDAIADKFQLSRVPIELAGIGATKRAVMAGAGLSCISRSVIELELNARQLAVVRTPWLDLRRQITFLLHRQKYLDPGLRAFLGFCGLEASQPAQP
ncbi:MAG TPA: LysR substrate-binding domain-containing protein [Bryobacteraceae bacterium]|nr:LysR substrate-binding domain-containing protein [Bryobacteraceae bacterium]